MKHDNLENKLKSAERSIKESHENNLQLENSYNEEIKHSKKLKGEIELF